MKKKIKTKVVNEELEKFALRVFYFLGHKEAIYSDPRMFYATIPVRVGSSFYGSLSNLTLGIYLKWIEEYANMVFKTDDGYGVVIQFGCGLSGYTVCNSVTNKGEILEKNPCGPLNLRKPYVEVRKRYFNEEEFGKCSPYSADEVYERLCEKYGEETDWEVVREVVDKHLTKD